MLSEREQLEGPIERKDPLKTRNNAIMLALFASLAVVIMLWPIWLLIIGVVVIVGFFILLAFAERSATLPAKQINAVLSGIVIWFVLLFVLAILASVAFVLCIYFLRKRQKLGK